MKDKEQLAIFNKDDFALWQQEWQNMPEFIQEDLTPYRQLIVSFETEEDVRDFIKLINQKITDETKSIWFPGTSGRTIKPRNFVYTQEDTEEKENKE